MSEVVSQIGTFTTDTSLIVRTWDAALVRLTRITADSVVGRPLEDVMPNLQTRGLLTRFQGVVETGAVHVFAPGIHHALLACPPLTPSRRFEQMQQRVTVAPLRQDNRITGVMATIEDVTARIEAERDLADALATAGDDWVARRAIVAQLPQAESADFAHALVEIIRTHHRDFSVLSSSLQLLAGTDVDVSESLTELLRDPDTDLRVQAALALGRQPSARAENALIGALSDSDMNVRFQAIESLGQIRSAAAVDRLVDIAQSDEVSLAFAAVEALAAIRSPGTAQKLAPLLARHELRLAVVHALGVLGDESAVGPLIAALNESSDMTLEVADAVDRVYQRLERQFAQGASVAHVVKTTLTERGAHTIVSAVRERQKPGPPLTRLLGWVGTADARAALVQLLAEPTVRQLATEMLPAHGESVVDLLLQQLDSDNDELRHAAIALLGNIGDARAVPALIALLPEAPQLATVVVGALARIADPASFDALLGLLAHPDAGVRHSAVGALNAMGHPDLPSRVNRLLDSPDPNQRESAIKIAGYFAYPAAYQRVLELTADPVEQVRCAAIESLPYFDDASAVVTLRTVLANGTDAVREAAARALARIDHPDAVMALRTALADDAQWVRYFAVRALRDRRDADAIPRLRQLALSDPSVPVRIAAIEALAALDAERASELFIPLASDAGDELAAAAVTGLGSSLSADVRPHLQRALEDSRRTVRLAALRAWAARPDDDAVAVLQRVAASEPAPDVRGLALELLGDIASGNHPHGDDAVHALVVLLTDGDGGEGAAAALARLPAARLESMAQHLRHPDALVRRAVVELLGRSRHSQATTLIVDALDDPSALVREAATLALARRRHVV